MALVVPARGAVPAVVLPLAPDALAAPLALLLGRLVAEPAVPIGVGHPTAQVMGPPVRGRRDRGYLAGTLHVPRPRAVLGLHRARPYFSPLLLPPVDPDRPGRGRRVEHRGHRVLEVGVVQLGVIGLHHGQHGVMGMAGGRGRESLDRARAEQLDVPLVEQLLLKGGHLPGLDGGRDQRVTDAPPVRMGGGQRRAERVEARQPDRRRDGRRVRYRGGRQRRERRQLGLCLAGRRELAREARQALGGRRRRAAPAPDRVLRLPRPVLAREHHLAPRVDQPARQPLVVVPRGREPEPDVLRVKGSQCRRAVHRVVPGEAAERRQVTRRRITWADRARRGRDRRRRASRHPLGGDHLLRYLGAHLPRHVIVPTT